MGSGESWSLIDFHGVIVMHQSFAVTTHGFMGKLKIENLHRVVVMHSVICSHGSWVRGKDKKN